MQLILIGEGGGGGGSILKNRKKRKEYVGKLDEHL